MIGSFRVNIKPFNPFHAKYFYILHSSPIVIVLICRIPVVCMFFQSKDENSVDPDQMAATEAIWSGSTVFSEKDKSQLNRTRVKMLYMYLLMTFADFFYQQFGSRSGPDKMFGQASRL